MTQLNRTKKYTRLKTKVNNITIAKDNPEISLTDMITVAEATPNILTTVRAAKSPTSTPRELGDTRLEKSTSQNKTKKPKRPQLTKNTPGVTVTVDIAHKRAARNTCDQTANARSTNAVMFMVYSVLREC